jgi:pimeloyl-ACP methyl ester carboxylesterase
MTEPIDPAESTAALAPADAGQPAADTGQPAADMGQPAADTGQPADGGQPVAAAPIRPWPGEPVRLPAGEVFVRSAPAPAGAEPALYVHGLGGSALNWTDLMNLLSQPAPSNGSGPPLTGAPLLSGQALDLPGFGFSPPPADRDYSLDARVAAVIALIEARNEGPVHLVGNSLGGAIGTRAAARRPDLVRTLTLISPALPDLRPRLLPMRLALVSAPGLGRWLMSKMLGMSAAERTDRSIGDLYADPARLAPQRRDEAIAEMIRRDGLPHAIEALLGSGRALVTEYTRHGPGSLWQDAARVAVPTLVIHGSHDRLVNPATAARAARTYPNCRVVVLPRIGHVAMMERPDLVAREVRAFLHDAAEQAADGRGALSEASR